MDKAVRKHALTVRYGSPNQFVSEGITTPFEQKLTRTNHRVKWGGVILRNSIASICHWLSILQYYLLGRTDETEQVLFFRREFISKPE